MRTPTEWQAELEQRGLGIFAPLVLKHIQPCLRVSLQKAGEYDLLSHEVDDKTAVGSSKLGGYPDLPPEFVWPTIEYADTEEVASVPFLAQIRLEDIAAVDEKNELPHTGMLSFFFDFQNLDCWQVFYFPHPLDGLQRRPAPPNIVAFNDSHYFPAIEAPYQLRFRRSDSIPGVTSVEIEAPFERIATENGITQQSDIYSMMDIYNALVFEGEGSPAHQLLGHEAIDYGRASADQWWQMVQNEAPVEEGVEESTINDKDLRQWRLLFQVDNDHRAGFDIGSGNGVIAFYIREEDLKRSDFSNVFATYLK